MAVVHKEIEVGVLLELAVMVVVLMELCKELHQMLQLTQAVAVAVVVQTHLQPQAVAVGRA